VANFGPAPGIGRELEGSERRVKGCFGYHNEVACRDCPGVIGLSTTTRAPMAWPSRPISEFECDNRRGRSFSFASVNLAILSPRRQQGQACALLTPARTAVSAHAPRASAWRGWLTIASFCLPGRSGIRWASGRKLDRCLRQNIAVADRT